MKTLIYNIFKGHLEAFRLVMDHSEAFRTTLFAYARAETAGGDTLH